MSPQILRCSTIIKPCPTIFYSLCSISLLRRLSNLFWYPQSLTLLESKSDIIRDASGSLPLEGVPPSLACVLAPSNHEHLVTSKIKTTIIEFTRTHNADAPDTFDLSDLHLFLPPDLVDSCSQYVSRKLSKFLFNWAFQYINSRLSKHLNGPFYIDKEIYIRINLPYNLHHKGTSSKTTHPNHRLSSYNNYLPKAFWAHGPHKDSWYGHSLNALNFWMAVNDLNTLIL